MAKKIMLAWPHTFGGGTFAAPGKHGYESERTSLGYYSISPVSSERGRHRGYLLSFVNDKGAIAGRGLHTQLGLHSSPNAAKAVALDDYKQLLGRAMENPTPPRELTNDDLNAAARGLGMWGMEPAELDKLIDEHKENGAFASMVIVAAARQILAVKRSRIGGGKRRRNPAKKAAPARRYSAKYGNGKRLEFNARSDAAAIKYAQGLGSRTRAGGSPCVSCKSIGPAIPPRAANPRKKKTR
jgi:hypothetical protein